MKNIRQIMCIFMLLAILSFTGCLAYSPEIKVSENGLVLNRTVTSNTNYMDLLAYYGGDTSRVSEAEGVYTYKDNIAVTFDNVSALEGYYGFKTVNAVALDDKQIKLYGTLWDKIDYANIAQGKKTNLRIIDKVGAVKNKDKKCKYIFGMDMDIIFFVYNEMDSDCSTVADFSAKLYNGLSDRLANAVVCTVVMNSGVDINFVGAAQELSESGRQKLYADLTTYLGSGTLDCDGALNAIIEDMYYDLRNKVDINAVDYSNMPKMTITGAVSVNGATGTELELFSDKLDTPFEIILDKTSVAVDEQSPQVTNPGDITSEDNDKPIEVEGEPINLDLKTVLIFVIIVLILIIVIVMVIKRFFGNKEVDVPQNDIAQRNVNKAVRNVNSMHGGKDVKVQNPKQNQFKTPDVKQAAQTMQQNIAQANQGLDMTAPMQAGVNPLNNQNFAPTQQNQNTRPIGQPVFNQPKPQNVFNQPRPQNVFSNTPTQNFGGNSPVMGGGNNAPFGGNNSTMGGNSAFGGNSPTMGGNNAPFGTNNTPFGGNNPTMGGNSAFGGNSPTMGGNNAPFGTNNTPFGGNSPTMGGNSAFGGNSPTMGGNSAFGGNSPTMGGNSAFGGNSQSVGGQTKTQPSYQGQGGTMGNQGVPARQSQRVNNAGQQNNGQGGISFGMLSSLGGVQDDDDDWD